MLNGNLKWKGLCLQYPQSVGETETKTRGPIIILSHHKLNINIIFCTMSSGNWLSPNKTRWSLLFIKLVKTTWPFWLIKPLNFTSQPDKGWQICEEQPRVKGQSGDHHAKTTCQSVGQHKKKKTRITCTRREKFFWWETPLGHGN